jgi:predicted RNase H-like HicB family nuclease
MIVPPAFELLSEEDGIMPDGCYYSLIEREEDGRFVGWVPDLPGIEAFGPTEDEVLHKLSGLARQCLHNLIMTGQPLPVARAADELPAGRDARSQRRLLLIIS